MTPDDRQSDLDHETLVAYLDGELDDAATVEVENRLASDSQYRQQLQQLERTWDLLDELPIMEPTEAFTRSTLELVVDDARKAIGRDRKKLWSIPLQMGIIAVFPILCYWITATYLQWRQEAPVRQLVSEIPFLEKYELYESVGSIEFAKLLDDQKLFEDFVTDDDTVTTDQHAWNPSSELLEQMDANQRVDLRRAKDRFENQLTDAERTGLKEFHEQLRIRDDRDQLLDTMLRYHTWSTEMTKTDQNSRQAVGMLGDKAPEERIRIVESLLKEQRQSMFGGNIPEGDKEIIYQWFEKLIAENETKIRSRIANLKRPGKRYSRYLDRVDVQSPVDFLARLLIRIDFDTIADLITAEQLEGLKTQLSKRSRQIISDKENDREQRKFIVLLNSRLYVSSEKLRDFYYNELTPEERSDLDNLFGARWRNAVRDMFLRNRFQDTPRIRPDWPLP